jgi:hypothetical protein
MANTQQEVIFYNEGIGGTAQRRFEKDLRKRQKEGWRVVSVTPTKQTFHHIFQLTVIYETHGSLKSGRKNKKLVHSRHERSLEH